MSRYNKYLREKEQKRKKMIFYLKIIISIILIVIFKKNKMSLFTFIIFCYMLVTLYNYFDLDNKLFKKRKNNHSYTTYSYEYEKEKKEQEYLDSFPNYAIVPKKYIDFSNIEIKEENDFKKSNIRIDLRADNGAMIFNEKTVFNFKEEDNTTYYIDKIFELTPDVLKEKLEYCFSEREELTLVFDSGNVYINKGHMKKIKKLLPYVGSSISFQDSKYKEPFVKGLLNLYFNCNYFGTKFKDNIKNHGIVISNSKKNKYYFATLTDIKPSKTRKYIDTMKELDIDLNTYEDIFGNTIEFKESNY